MPVIGIKQLKQNTVNIKHNLIASGIGFLLLIAMNFSESNLGILPVSGVE
jgi:hypothetical protein